MDDIKRELEKIFVKLWPLPFLWAALVLCGDDALASVKPVCELAIDRDCVLQQLDQPELTQSVIDRVILGL